MQTYSLFEINEYIRQVFALNFADAIWISADIAQCNESNGHYYLELVQKNENDEIIAHNNGILWNRNFNKLFRKNKQLKQLLNEGNEIKFKAQIQFSERYGLSFHIEDFDLDFTMGKIWQQKQQTIDKLQLEGITYLNRTIPLPKVIQNIALISSEQAAGLQDFLAEIKKNLYNYHFNIQLFPAQVQGKNAANSIINQLKKIPIDEFDIVAIVRGGGSRLDLVAFDEYNLAKEIALFSIPIIVGIGHEIDETVCDITAHTSFITPTAVAQYLIEHNAIFEDDMIKKINSLMNFVHNKIIHQNQHINQIEQNILWKSKDKINNSQLQLNLKQQQINHAFNVNINQYKNDIQGIEKWMESNDIIQIWEKGFAYISQENKNINSIHKIKNNKEISLLFKDGEAIATIIKIIKNGK